ncbi:MAG: serine hydrolase, partial [Desulfobacterales bacterium]|nr:serine hydrolase [Desulfobacterales bacterium]
MKLAWRCLAFCGRTLIILVALHSTSFAEESLERLRSRIEAAIPSAQGAVGVSIKHMESGIAMAVHGDEQFPMASTFKLPLLVELYAKEKEGAFRWDDLVEISSTDQHLGSSGLTALYDTPGVVLSIRNLANLMIIASDNSAADICFSKVGGPSKVTAGMRRLGIYGIRIDRSCQELILDYGGRDT